jgi:GSH-dependent disulfide-bond oxidoreductase
MPIELHTWNTPNGCKISVALEEIDLSYSVQRSSSQRGWTGEVIEIRGNGEIVFRPTKELREAV